MKKFVVNLKKMLSAFIDLRVYDGYFDSTSTYICMYVEIAIIRMIKFYHTGAVSYLLVLCLDFIEIFLLIVVKYKLQLFFYSGRF